jgi:hypothetical protein
VLTKIDLVDNCVHFPLEVLKALVEAVKALLKQIVAGSSAAPEGRTLLDAL